MNQEYSVRELRMKLKEALDRAAQGEVITITRGAEKFELSKSSPKKINSDASIIGPEQVLAESMADFRTMGDVLLDIKNAQRERDEALEFNQDPDSRKFIQDKSQALIQQLWNEYHTLKGE